MNEWNTLLSLQLQQNYIYNEIQGNSSVVQNNKKYNMNKSRNKQLKDSNRPSNCLVSVPHNPTAYTPAELLLLTQLFPIIIRIIRIGLLYWSPGGCLQLTSTKKLSRWLFGFFFSLVSEIQKLLQFTCHHHETQVKTVLHILLQENIQKHAKTEVSLFSCLKTFHFCCES